MKILAAVLFVVLAASSEHAEAAGWYLPNEVDPISDKTIAQLLKLSEKKHGCAGPFARASFSFACHGEDRFFATSAGSCFPSFAEDGSIQLTIRFDKKKPVKIRGYGKIGTETVYVLGADADFLKQEALVAQSVAVRIHTSRGSSTPQFVLAGMADRIEEFEAICSR